MAVVPLLSMVFVVPLTPSKLSVVWLIAPSALTGEKVAVLKKFPAPCAAFVKMGVLVVWLFAPSAFAASLMTEPSLLVLAISLTSLFGSNDLPSVSSPSTPSLPVVRCSPRGEVFFPARFFKDGFVVCFAVRFVLSAFVSSVFFCRSVRFVRGFAVGVSVVFGLSFVSLLCSKICSEPSCAVSAVCRVRSVNVFTSGCSWFSWFDSASWFLMPSFSDVAWAVFVSSPSVICFWSDVSCVRSV